MSAILPQIYLAILLTDLIGLIRMRNNGSNFAAKWHAGPDPIDLPLTIIFLLLTPNTYFTNKNTVYASYKIYSALFLVYSL